MQKVSTAKMRGVAIIGFCLLLALWLNPQPPGTGQDWGRAQYAAELKDLRNQLSNSAKPGEADAVLILGQRALAEAARALAGLEIKLASGAVLRITSAAIEVKSTAALVRFGVQASSSASDPAVFNLHFTGRLMPGEVSGTSLRLPFKLTEITPGSGEWSSPLFRRLFSDWLSPERWNAALPPLELPLELSEVIEIPAGQFDIEGTMPMAISTPAYQVRVNFSVSSLIFINGQAVMTLRLAPAAMATGQVAMPSGLPKSSQTPAAGVGEREAAALEAEVAQLSQQLNSSGDLLLRLHHRAINSLLAQVAAARDTDLAVRLKPARLRSEEVTGLIRTLNYTDIEGGDGQADLRGLAIERVAGKRLGLRLIAEGALKAKLRGRECGIPYRLSPEGTFTIKERVVPLEVVDEGDQIWLRVVPGSQLPIEVGMDFEVVGHNLGLSHTVMVEADRWFNRLVFPTLVSRELQVPRQIEAGSGGMRVVRSEALRYSLSKLRVKPQEDAIDITSEVSISHR